MGFLTAPRLAMVLVPIRQVAIVLLVLATFVSTSCSARPQPDRFDYLRLTVDGQPTLAVSKKETVIRGVVIYFHGLDGSEFDITSSPARQAVTESLVDAGFALISSYASGNAIGPEKAQRNYRELANMGAEYYRAENVYFIADSIGAVPALNMMRYYTTARIRGLVAVNPLIDLTAASPATAPVVSESFPSRTALEAANPIGFPADAFKGKDIRFYVSESDPAVPPEANAKAFLQRFGGSADVSLERCEVSPQEPSCLDATEILKWFADLERRAG